MPIKLQGVFVPLATPFDHNGDLYRNKVRYNVEKWNRVKLSGYVVASSTGEGPHLTSGEKVALWGIVAESAAPDRLLIADASAESVRETAMLANDAAGAGYKAALARTPCHYRQVGHNPSAQESYFAAVADRAKIPIIAAHSGVELPEEAISRLSAHPNIAAIVDATGNLDRLVKIREAAPGFPVLTSIESAVWPWLHAGGAGAMLAFANAAPYACVTIWEAHRMREEEAAADWQQRISHPAVLVTEKYGVAGLKHAMDLNGYYGGPCRLPLGPLTPAAKAEIAEAFREIRG